MSQESILSLMKRKKWYSIKDVAPILNISIPSCSKNFKQLVKYKDVYNLNYRKGKKNRIFLSKK